jgi:hypothetical protein
MNTPVVGHEKARRVDSNYEKDLNSQSGSDELMSAFAYSPRPPSPRDSSGTGGRPQIGAENSDYNLNSARRRPSYLASSPSLKSNMTQDKANRRLSGSDINLRTHMDGLNSPVKSPVLRILEVLRAEEVVNVSYSPEPDISVPNLKSRNSESAKKKADSPSLKQAQGVSDLSSVPDFSLLRNTNGNSDRTHQSHLAASNARPVSSYSQSPTPVNDFGQDSIAKSKNSRSRTVPAIAPSSSHPVNVSLPPFHPPAPIRLSLSPDQHAPNENLNSQHNLLKEENSTLKKKLELLRKKMREMVIASKRNNKPQNYEGYMEGGSNSSSPNPLSAATAPSPSSNNRLKRDETMTGDTSYRSAQQPSPNNEFNVNDNHGSDIENLKKHFSNLMSASKKTIDAQGEVIRAQEVIILARLFT